MTLLAQTYPQLAVQLADAGWSPVQLASTRAAYELAASLFAACERGSGKPFIDHLVGVASGVLLGGGDADAVAAALLHAAYDQGDFGDGRSPARAANRHRVRGAVGPAVEDLVFRYHQLAWSPTIASRAVAGFAAATPPERTVLLMRVANEVDDAIDGGLVLSGKQHLAVHALAVHEAVVWLADRVGTPRLSGLAREVLVTPPPVLPVELIVGQIASRRRLPSSARPRLRVRVVTAGLAVEGFARRRMPPRVKRLLRGFRGHRRTHRRSTFGSTGDAASSPRAEVGPPGPRVRR